MDIQSILAEALKIILPGIGGYGARTWQDRNKKRRMRRQLYSEISKNYHNIAIRIAVCTSLPGLREGAALRFTEKLDISFYAWNFNNDDKRKELLFDLKEAAEISQVYEKLNSILIDLPSYAMTRAREAMAVTEEHLFDKTFDRGLYKAVSLPDAWKNMEAVLSGKRQKSRVSLGRI